MTYCITGPAIGGPGVAHVHRTPCCAPCARPALGDVVSPAVRELRARALEATANYVHDPNGARDRLVPLLQAAPGAARNHLGNYLLGQGRPPGLVNGAMEGAGGWYEERSLARRLLGFSLMAGVAAVLLLPRRGR